MKAAGIGIIGLGSYLPSEVRKNNYWSLETFQKNSQHDIGTASAELLADLMKTDSGRIAIEEMGKWKDDPYHGALERRVAPEGMRSSDMEVEAGKAALADAGLKPSDIGLLLLNSFLPDRPVPGNSGPVHGRLGLPLTSPAMGVDGVCGSFLLQLQLGAAYIRAGGAKYVLLIQSALQSRCLDHTRPLSITFGDAATAVVLGPVAPENGVLSCVSFNDGSYCDVAVLAGDRDRPWYEGTSRMQITSCDLKRVKEVIFKSGDMARMAVDRALEESGLTSSDVQFFTSHQTIAAFNPICRRATGLEHTKTVDTFRAIGSVSACAIPFNLQAASRDGMIRPGDVAAVFTTGSGFNWSAAILRWGK
jgi:3-oxoacyl-[acyl-carrier-protein] synthase III